MKRYLIILNDEDYLDVYDIKDAPEAVVGAVITLYCFGYTVPCKFSELYWKESLENETLFDEYQRPIKFHKHPDYVLCEDYCEVEE